MKKLLVIFPLILSSCVFVNHETNAAGIVSFAQEMNEEKPTVVNVLWYRGRDEVYDYFKYVYGMFSERSFKVKVGGVEVEKPFPYTNDHKKWNKIESIDVKWSFLKQNN